MNFRQVSLDDIADFQNGKALPSSAYSKSGIYPVYGSNGEIGRTNTALNDGPSAVIGRVGANCGTVYYVSGASWVTDNAIMAFPKSQNDHLFLYYLLRSLDLRKTAIGSAQPLVTQGGLKVLEVTVPDCDDQVRIGRNLNALDQNIELNERINNTLYEIARAIFKHWFIDFEFPNENGESYKSSGGEMIDSPLGPIPVGWRVGFINDIEFEIVPGDWGKGELSERYSSPVRCIRGADIREISSGGIGNPPLRYIKPLSAEVKSLRDTDVVVEISGGSPTQQTGRAMRIIEPITKKFAENLICSNFCKLLRFRNIEDSEFTYFLLDNLYRREIMFQYENGTTGIKNLDFKNLFSTEQVVIPNRKVLQQFAGYSRQIDSMIQLNGIQNMMLSRIRDSLLPKLMSGEIRVPVSDKEVDQF